MAYDGWLELGGEELINLSRTVQLAEVLDIDVVWTDPESVAWIDTAFGATNYDQITASPWYDPSAPASAEFAGVLPLALAGLDDSTLEASTIEYVTDGGSSGQSRNKTLSIVVSAALVASTPRGADYGKRWLDARLRSAGAQKFCSGSEVRYFQHEHGEGGTPALVHRRDVSLTRGTTITRKSSDECATTWWVTYTWTANDPFEYSEEMPLLEDLGGTVEGPTVIVAGQTALVSEPCPIYDYSPIYDPDTPALIPPPPPPDVTNAAMAQYWDGAPLLRYWAVLEPVTPRIQRVVPVVTLTCTKAARGVRVSFWSEDADTEVDCGPMWTAFVSYLPPNVDFVIDGEQQVAYAWDRMSPNVRRTDSLVYGQRERPLQWTALQSPAGYLVTLDIIDEPEPGPFPSKFDDYYDGGGTVRAALSFVAKSD